MLPSIVAKRDAPSRPLPAGPGAALATMQGAEGGSFPRIAMLDLIDCGSLAQMAAALCLAARRAGAPRPT